MPMVTVSKVCVALAGLLVAVSAIPVPNRIPVGAQAHSLLASLPSIYPGAPAFENLRIHSLGQKLYTYMSSGTAEFNMLAPRDLIELQYQPGLTESFRGLCVS